MKKRWKEWNYLRSFASRSFSGVLILLLSVLQVSCGRDKTAPNPPGGNAVTAIRTVQLIDCTGTDTVDIAMQDSTFIPSSVHAEAGTVVKWTNYETATDHSVNSDMVPENGSFNSSVIKPGQSVCYKFTAPGIYSYHCSDHMQATITIE